MASNARSPFVVATEHGPKLELAGLHALAIMAALRLCGFELSLARFTSSLAFIASIAASAVQPGTHALADGALPTAPQLHAWLRAALTCSAVVDIKNIGIDNMHFTADTCTTHSHTYPAHAAHLQHCLTAVATNSLYQARVTQVKEAAGDERELASLYGRAAKFAGRRKTVRPTEAAYKLSDEYYRYSARRDLGLPPTRDRVLAHRCGDCRGCIQ